jgi:phage baseplate assembly protein W
MNPEFGSGLWNILFESYTDDITPIIESTIKKDINLWMPFVAVQKVSAVTSSTQYGRIDVTVLFTAPSAGVMATQELTMGVANNTL